MFAVACSVSLMAQDSLYHEKYRPQYHFTPAHRWIGDPCGLIKHNGKYLAYSWGAAETEDLVHWIELNNHAILGVPKGISTFTGSVVVDKNGSVGYGEDALIAAFTSFDEQTKKQSQSIAFSRDGGVTYQYYDQNPVLDIWSTEFRDPTVIWDEKTGKWIMLVAKALEKKVAFYSSDDLKHWQWLSEFGPMGDSERSWECPDMFRLAVDGNPENKKCVMVISVNWAREQYFIGDFNGKEFVPDSPNSEPQYIDEGLDYYASRVFQNYDNSDEPVYTIGWVNTWDYANQAPTTYGKGIWSIPREYKLKSTDEGLRLIQLPFVGLETLRGKPFNLNTKLPVGVKPLKEIAKMGNTYEIDATFNAQRPDQFGFYLCEGSGRKLVINYDTESQMLTVDRTNVTDADIPKFKRMAFCQLQPENGSINLRVFVDKSTVEIFANNGEKVMTLLTYPSESQTGASVYSHRGSTNLKLSAWSLDSSWQNSL